MKPAPPVKTKGATPLEKMIDLTRRVVAVPKSEIPIAKTRKKRKHQR